MLSGASFLDPTCKILEEWECTIGTCLSNETPQRSPPSSPGCAQERNRRRRCSSRGGGWGGGSGFVGVGVVVWGIAGGCGF